MKWLRVLLPLIVILLWQLLSWLGISSRMDNKRGKTDQEPANRAVCQFYIAASIHWRINAQSDIPAILNPRMDENLA